MRWIKLRASGSFVEKVGFRPERIGAATTVVAVAVIVVMCRLLLRCRDGNFISSISFVLWRRRDWTDVIVTRVRYPLENEGKYSSGRTKGRDDAPKKRGL